LILKRLLDVSKQLKIWFSSDRQLLVASPGAESSRIDAQKNVHQMSRKPLQRWRQAGVQDQIASTKVKPRRIKGNERSRSPAAEKMAFARAGATGGTASS
jgi:hypothetical protein